MGYAAQQEVEKQTEQKEARGVFEYFGVSLKSIDGLILRALTGKISNSEYDFLARIVADYRASTL